MRSCKPFTTPSSRDDVNEAKVEMDEVASPASVLSYASALVRSEEEANVLHGIDYLSNNEFEEQEQKVQTVFLKALALYRLKRDKDCLEVIQEAKAQSISSTEIDQIRDKICKDQQKEKNEKIAIGAGIAATVAAGIAVTLGVIFGTRRKK